MSAPPLQRGQLQQPPLSSPFQSRRQHDEVEEHLHQPTRRSPEDETLLDSLSFTESTDSTVADLKHGGNYSGRHDGEWRLGYEDEDVNDTSVVHEQGEVDYSLVPSPRRAEIHTEHWPRCRRGRTEEEEGKAGDVITARQPTSPESRLSTELRSSGCNSSEAEAGAGDKSSSDSLIPNSDDGWVAHSHRELNHATSHRIGSEEVDEGDTSYGTPHISSREQNKHSTIAAASQCFEHAAQTNPLPRTSRQLVYTDSGTMFSPTLTDDVVEDSDFAAGVVTALTTPDTVHDDQDSAAAAPIVRNLEAPAVSRGTLQHLYVVESDMNDAALSAPGAGTSRSSSPALQAKEGSLKDPIAQESGETEALQNVHRRPPPLSVASPSELKRADTEMESAMREMAEQLRWHDHHVGATVAGANSDGGVASRGNTPSFRRSDGESQEESEANRPVNRHRNPSSSFSVLHNPTADAADADAMKSVREDDWLVRQRYSQADVGNAESFNAHRSGRALGNESPAPASAAYKFFSRQLQPPEDRRARISELAKALRWDGSRGTFTGPSGGPLASPPAEGQPRDSMEGVATLCTPCAANSTSHSHGEPMQGAAGVVMLSLPNTSAPSLQGEVFSPHQQELMMADLQVYYNNSCRLGVGAEEHRRCPGLSDSPLLESSVVEGMPTATTAEGISTGVAGAAVFSVDFPATPPRMPLTSRRQRPPPRMLCPPTPSPSPSRSTAMDAMFAVAAAVEEGEALDAGVVVPSFSEVAPGAEPQRQPQLSSINTPPGQSALELCTTSAGVEVVSSSLCRSPLWVSSASEALADAVVSVVAPAVATVATAAVDGDVRVSVVSSSSSCHKMAEEDNVSADMDLLGALDCQKGALSEPCAAADTSVAVNDADRSLMVSLCSASSESSQPRLNYSDHTVASSAYRSDSAPQQVGVVAIKSASRAERERAVFCTTFQGSTSTRNAAVSAAVPVVRQSLMRHDDPGEDSSVVLVDLIPFPYGRQRGDRMALSSLPRDGCGDAVASWSISSVARASTETESAVAAVSDATDDIARRQVISTRQSASARKLRSAAAVEGEEHPYVQLTLFPFSAASPSPIRPSLSNGSEKVWQHYEAPTLSLYTGGGGEVGECYHDDADSSNADDEAHLRYDDGTCSPAEPTAAAAACPTRKSEILDDLYSDGDCIEEQAYIEEALCRAEAKSARLRLEPTSAAARTAEAEAKAQARELECAELHMLVSRMQVELAAAQTAAESTTTKTRIDAEVQVVACTNLLDGTATAAASLSISPNQLDTATPSTQKDIALSEAAVWQRRHDAVAQELAILKGNMAEQLAVLDRLGMQPPFSEELVRAAERRLRHVKVAHAPVTATKISQPAVTLSETPHTPTRPTCVDSTASLGFPTGGTSVTATAKMQVRNGNTIAVLLSQRKQDRHLEQPAATDGVATGAAGSATASSTLAPPGKRDGRADCSSPLDAKENCVV
ncbi:hypothetical protein LPMP_352210 [Leishmania panamensis]|uniref:Uncharacterized protein n=1 Tax=Leishmania panamensis TaxID=5679 RepID=A0A088S1S8_LEIPA|nr:hypothetical protein LPMP_352210 [Leishmania panamensis]AIO02358.1 hypothetical protein LPMP_352210 [Leishmania panamensis]